MPCKSNCIDGFLLVPAKMYEKRTKRRFDVGGSSATPPPPPVRDQYPWPREREDKPIPLFDNFDNTRKAAKSEACRNRAIEDAWDDYDIIFYNEWLRVSIEPTRFVDPDVIHTLGIKDENGTHLVRLPLRQLTDFDHGLASIQFRPDPRLVRAPSAQPRRYTVQRTAGPQPHQPEAALPPFPPMPDMSTRPEGDFHHVVVDALTTIWARVSRCRCSSRRSVRASSPSAARQSRQHRDTSSDETTDED
ncbi:hypothetical protein F2Q70_00016416 [Brassica cretica]|uniref:Uncharacterized protein n=1 Tax=Brassica cretica TaxID=69181 RepID=A0A8S9KQF5_BRACR|nr:hypothetical protein F2Q70_00016416 [Brassica cretica]KAF2595658.1 hypothetical protein F2Q68_00009384 [Brassica cretica]